MQILIDIPKEDYEYLKTHNKHGLYSSILNGTVLPKGHGRLKDESQINETMEREFKERKGLSYIDLLDIIHFTPTILKADKE